MQVWVFWKKNPHSQIHSAEEVRKKQEEEMRKKFEDEALVLKQQINQCEQEMVSFQQQVQQLQKQHQQLG